MKKPKQRPSSETGPKAPPSVIMLPGGKVVRSYDFRITNVDADGRPTAFELAKVGENSDCVLWAHDVFIEQPLIPELMRRYESRLTAGIDYAANSRDIQPAGVFDEKSNIGQKEIQAMLDFQERMLQLPEHDVETQPFEKVDSIGRCTLCGYEGPGPKHDCPEFPRQHMGRPVDWVCGKCGDITRNLTRNECNSCGEPV